MGVARFRPARIHLLDGSLYTWLGAKALSQFSLMGGNPRGILYNRNPDVPFTVDSGQDKPDGLVDVGLAVMMMRIGHTVDGIGAKSFPFTYGSGKSRVTSCNATLLCPSFYFLEFSAHRRVMDAQVRGDLLQPITMLSVCPADPGFPISRKNPFQCRLECV